MIKKVLITTTGYSDGSLEKEILEPLGVKIEIAECKTEDDVIANGKEAYGLFIAYTPIREKVIQELPNLKIVVRCGIGVDNIDLQKAKEKNIMVVNIPDYCWDEVADHTISLMLSSERRIVMQDEMIKAGEWLGIKPVKSIRGLRDRKLGLIGFGNIGKKVAQRALAFNMQVLVYDPYIKPEMLANESINLVALDDLLKESDFISLQTPLTPETQHIIDREAISKMKSSTFIINTARGPLIDRHALLDAVESGAIAGAALDVIEDELEGTKGFSKFSNVILTPHTAWYSEQSYYQLRKKAAEEMARFIRGESVLHPLT